MQRLHSRLLGLPGLKRSLGVSPSKQRTAWYHQGSSLDLNFAGNRVFGSPSFASALTVARASTGYAEDEAGNWLPFAANAPRITSKGILIEEARTNSIRNNTMVGAVVGTPGTMPTNWAGSLVTPGLAQQILGMGVVKGINYLDVRIFGTLSSSGVSILFFDQSDRVLPAATGVAVTASVFAQVISAVAMSGWSLDLVVREDNGGVFVRQTQTDVKQFTASMTRVVSSVVTGASTTHVCSGLRFAGAAGLPVDCTLRIGWPQLELGAFATSPIPTTGAAATRAADVISVNSPADYASFAQGSMFAEFLDPHGVSGSVNTRGVVGLRADGSNATRLFIEQTTSKVVAPNMAAGAVVAALTSANPTVAGGIYKAACGWQLDDVTGAFSPSLGPMQYDTSAAMPTGSPSVLIGTYTGGGAQLNGYLRRATFFPSALSDARLSELVA